MKNNIYTAIPDWFNKVQSQSTDNTSTTTTQTTIIGGGGSISMSVHNLFIKSDTTITIDNFTISDLFVTDQITDTENWLTTPLLHTLPNTEVSVTTAAQQLYIGAYDKNNNQIKLYQFSEAISTVVIPENCYYLRASSNKTNTDLTIKYVGLNNFDETQQNKLESSSFQNFLTLVEGDEKGVITNSVQNLSLVFQNPLYYTLDKAGNVLISIDRDALFSQSENPTDDRYVTTVANSVQDILSSKNFKEGLSINGIEIVERNGFLYIKGNLATTGGITAYTDDPDDPGGSGGLPGGGAIRDIVITGSGNALVDASLSEDHSVITFTKGWLVDAESDQSITGIKDFINGIKLDGQLIKIVDGVLWLDCSIAATGGITAYATMPGEGSSSIMDQLVVDTEYFIITEEGVLTIVPGSVGGISNIYVTGNGNALTTATLSEDGKTISFTKDKTFADDTEIKRIISEFKNEVNGQLKRFVTLDTEQEITAIKHFIEGITIGSNKHKFYEKDGVLWLEGDIAITGGITTYATENVDVSTIMDGVAVDEITITKGSDNVLRIKNAGAGSSFDENSMWSALASSSDKQINKSHLTTALTGYATEIWVTEKGYITSSALNGYATESWVSGKNYAVKATTLAGYGITNAYTKTDADSRYVNVSGDTMTGNLSVKFSGRTDQINLFHSTTTNRGGLSLTDTDNTVHAFHLTTTNLLWKGRTVWDSGNDGSESGLDADLLDGTHKSGLLTALTSSSGTNISITVGGTTKSITDLYAYASTKLETARTLWGRSFDGTQNVSGDMSNVGNIDTNYAYVNAKTFAYNPADVHDDGYPWYGFTYGGDSKIHISGYAGILFYTSAGNVLTLASDARVYANSYVSNDWFRSEGNSGWYSIRGGGGWYMSDTYFIRSYGEKSVYLGNGSYRNGGGGYAANNINNASEVYNCRFMSEGVGAIPAGNIRNILGWYDSAANGWQTSYIIGSKRNYNNNWGEMTFGVYQYEGNNMSMKMFMSLDGANNYLYVEGNLLVTGGVTLYGSDIRYKSIIQQVKLSLLDIAKAPSFVYHWNREGMKCDRLNIGGSAQYTQSVLPWAVEEKNNLLSMDYATVAYTFSVHTARHLLDYETKTDKEIRKLKNRIKYLEKQLKSLYYEEANIVDN